MKIEELENVLLSQIEALSDNDFLAKPEDAEQLISRSKAMSELTNSYIDIQKTKIEAQRVKIEVVKVAQNSVGLGYESYLGIDAPDIKRK